MCVLCALTAVWGSETPCNFNREVYACVCASMETGIGMERARDRHRTDGVLLLLMSLACSEVMKRENEDYIQYNTIQYNTKQYDTIK